MKNFLPIPLSGFLIALSIKQTVAYACTQSEPNWQFPVPPSLLCVGTILQDMPQNFSKEITLIEFMYCTITKFTSESFAMYPDIITLNFEYSTIKQISEKTFLLPLKKLLKIAVSNPDNLTLSHFPQWILPPSIQTILYWHDNLKTTNFAEQNLPLLQTLNLMNNSLTSFPILEPTFTLLELVVSQNPDMEVTVEHLFPLCKLEKIWLDPQSKTKPRLTKTWTICHCLRLKRYLELNKIRNDFAKYSCGNATNENCSFNFDGKYTPDDVRRVCLPPIFKPTTSTTSTTTNQPMVPEERSDSWLMKALAILILLLLLIATISTILVFLRRNKETKEVELESTEDMTWEGNEGNEEELSPNEN